MRSSKTVQAARHTRAKQLSQANAALRTEIRERQRAEQIARGQTEALFKIIAALALEPDVENFMGCALQAIVEQLGAEAGEIWLYEEALNATYLFAEYRDGKFTAEFAPEDWRAARTGTAPGWDDHYLPRLRAREVLIHTNQELIHAPGYAYGRENPLDYYPTAALIAPLFFADRFLGNLTLRRNGGPFAETDDAALAQALAGQVSLAIHLSRLAQQARQEARQAAVLEERNRFARDLHDAMGQIFTGISIQLERAKAAVPTENEKAQTCLREARDLAHAGLEEARQSVWALRSHSLCGDTFSVALNNLIQSHPIRAALPVECRILETPALLTPTMKDHLLRIAQEGLTNVLKHAHARRVEVSLTFTASHLHLSIRDDGCGMSGEGGAASAGFGLTGMAERAAKMGGQFTLISQPGQGAALSVQVPLERLPVV